MVQVADASAQKTYIVFLKPEGEDPAYTLNKFLSYHKIDDLHPLFYLGPGFVAKLEEGEVKGLLNDPQVEEVIPSSELKLDTWSVNLTIFGNFSYYQGWNFTGKGVVVAVIDTGVDYSIQALGGKLGVKVIGGYDYVDMDEDPLDLDGHGTAVAGIIAANGTNFKGIAPGAKLLAYRIFGLNETVETYMIIQAIERAIEDGADIVNLSLGGGIDRRLLWKVGQRAVQRGVLLVAAAGNDGPDRDSLYAPASLPPYIGVGATTSPWANVRYTFLKAGDEWIETARPMNNSPLADVKGELVIVGHGRVEDIQGMDLTGKIAVSFRDRKTYFGEMELNVASKGAIGLIVVNDEDHSLSASLAHPAKEDYVPTIPTVTVSSSDGQKILEKGYVELSVFKTEGRILPSFFSSRGGEEPFTIKPDILAYGEEVPIITKGGIILSSGTSLSAPQVSGALALLLEKEEKVNKTYVLSLLYLSATPLYRNGEPFPPYIQGAGLLNITKMLELDLFADPPTLTLYPSPNSDAEGVVKLRTEFEVSWDGPLSLEKVPRRGLKVRASYTDDEEFSYLKIETPHGRLNYLVRVIPCDFELEVRGTEIYVHSLEEGEKVAIKITYPSGRIETFEGKAPKVGSLRPQERGEYFIQATAGDKKSLYIAYFETSLSEPGNPPRYMPFYLLIALLIYSSTVALYRFRSRASRGA